MKLREFIEKLEALEAEHGGDILVITSGYVDVKPVFHNRKTRFIGGSEWDSRTYSNLQEPGSGKTITV